jgi:hypothetical protein
MSRSSSRPSRIPRTVPILGGIALLGLVLTNAVLAGTKDPTAQTDPSPSPQARERRTLPDDQAPFIVIGVLALTITPVILGIKAAKRKGVSPHWMWFGLHPVGGWIAYLIIRSRPDRRPVPPPHVGNADRIVPTERPSVPAMPAPRSARTDVRSGSSPAATHLVNRGDRQDDLQQAMAYWIERMSSPVKDPFVMYFFETGKDAREALLDLPCIHEGPDGKLICTEPLIFGYYRQSDGLYEAVICGDKLTHDLWKRAKSSFESHGGRRKNDLEPVVALPPAPPAGPASPEDVVFVREERKPTKLGSGIATYRIHKGPDEASARAFLECHPVTKEFHYLVVETPEGSFGRDIQGIYQEPGSLPAVVGSDGPPASVPLSASKWFEVLADLCHAYQQNDRAAIDRLEPVATAIGEELNRLGGKRAMLAMWESLENRPGTRTLDMHWSGIGEWMG